MLSIGEAILDPELILGIKKPLLLSAICKIAESSGLLYRAALVVMRTCARL